MSDIREVERQATRNALGNICHGNAALAAGTTAGTIKTVNAVSVSVGGVLSSKAATDNIAVTAAAVQPVSTDCMYAILCNASGTISTVKGVAVAAGAGASLPDLTAAQKSGNAVIGAVKVNTNSSTTFTAGTTSFGAAGITSTFYNLTHAIPGTF